MPMIVAHVMKDFASDLEAWSHSSVFVTACVDISLYGHVLPLTTESDLSGLFDWNTKQLFVLVTAHYQTRNNVSSNTCIYSSLLPDLITSNIA